MSFSCYPKYKEIGQEWLGEIPERWSLLKLKRIATIRYGIGEPPRYHDTGTPLVRATNVNGGNLSYDGMVFVDPTEIPEQRIAWLQAGDIIVVRSGAYTGDSAIIPVGFGPSIAGFDMVLKCHSANPQFIQFALLSKYLKEGQIDLEKMRAAQPHLNAEELGSCQLALPSAQEQTFIVSFLNRETAKIDGLISEQRLLMELLEEKRQAVISRAVTNGLNPQAPTKSSGIDWVGDVPAHWSCVRNKVIFEEIDDRSATNDGELMTVSHITGVTPRAEKDVNMFLAETLKGYKKCQRGDLVINTMWAWMGALGCSSCDGVVSPSYNVYRPRRTGQLFAEFYDYLCRIPTHKVAIKANSTGIWESRLRLYPRAFLDMQLALPPLEEQVAITKHLNLETAKWHALTTEAEHAINLLEEHRTALISAAVTGQIDVRQFAKSKAAA